MGKQKPIRPIEQPKDDEEKYGNTGISCDGADYTCFSSQPALMGTMAKADQKRKKKYRPDAGYNSYKILDQLERM